jgi:ABC-type multidrug transport system fused ATPase/permease subunit
LKQIIKNILAILTPGEKRKFFKLILFDVVISILDISFLVLLLYVINFYTQPHHSITHSSFPFNVFDEYPLLLITVFFFLFCIKNLFGFLVFRMQYRYVYGVASGISKNNLLNYLEGSFSDYVNIDSSVHTRRIAQQPIEFSHYVLRGVQQIISQSILIVLTIVPILIYNPVLFPILFLILMPPVFLIAFFMKRRLNSIRVSGKTTSEKAIQHLKEALSGFIESNIYDSKNFFTNRYHRLQAKLNAYLSEQLIIQDLPSRLIEVFAILGLFILILINSFTTKSNSVQVLTIGAFVAAAYKIIPGIVKILNSAGQVKTYSFTMSNLLYKQHTPVKKKDNNNAIVSFEFVNVSFSYEEEKVFNNFSLTMARGDFVGLSGISGRGKTTVINLLLGFLKPSSGTILINDSLTEATDRQEYWANISYIKQQPFLIYDSILNNIILDDNCEDIQRMENVVKAAGIEEFPGRYNKVITENGKNISGGQRQRIAIARALYKDADLIILDEPFNELDRDSENLLLQHFTELSKQGKIILLITHNKESLSFCNKIISLDEA